MSEQIEAGPYAGIELPQPPEGYRLARWQETMSDPELKVKFWVNQQWGQFRLGKLTVECYSIPSMSIFAVPEDRPAMQLQPGCKWVKAGWALQPTDFRIMVPTGPVTAEQQGRAWSIALTDHTWQRPKLLDVNLLYTMKCIKTAANALPEIDKQKFIWEMLQIQSQAGAALSKLRERAEAAAKALESQP